jgi:hypothetical protein
LRVSAAASFNGSRDDRSRIMIVAMLMLMMVMAVLAAEIVWLMVDP